MSIELNIRSPTSVNYETKSTNHFIPETVKVEYSSTRKIVPVVKLQANANVSSSQMLSGFDARHSSSVFNESGLVTYAYSNLWVQIV